MADPKGTQPVLTAVDTWSRGARYVRRIQVTQRDELGELQPKDLSSYDALTANIEGCAQGTKPVPGSISAQWDESHGGAALGAIRIFATAEAMDLDREGELGCVRVTVVAVRGAEDLVVANITVNVLETAIR